MVCGKKDPDLLEKVFRKELAISEYIRIFTTLNKIGTVEHLSVTFRIQHSLAGIFVE